MLIDPVPVSAGFFISLAKDQNMKPLLSILIPSIPSRFESHLFPLWKELQRQINNYGVDLVEVLILTDNKQRSIGAKRQALLNLAQGEYIAYLDDDDTPEPDYIGQFIGMIQAIPIVDVYDVITFRQHVWVNGEYYPLTFHLGYQANEEPNKEGFTRPPWHVCFWRRDIVQHCTFPDTNYGEDWAWAEQANKKAQTSYHIDRFMMTYYYDEKISEAAL